MRLKISTQPISTNRSPRNGSSPVVSVSRTISRMEYGAAEKGESGSPTLHFSSLIQNVANSRTHWIKTTRRIHYEMRAPSFFGVGHLPCQDRLKLFLGHVGASENSLALKFSRRGDHDHRIDPLF